MWENAIREATGNGMEPFYVRYRLSHGNGVLSLFVGIVGKAAGSKNIAVLDIAL